MAKISIATVAAAPTAVPPQGNETTAGPVETRLVFATAATPIQVRHHALKPDGTVHWHASKADHCVYVTHGTVEIGGVEVTSGGMFVVEHGASAEAAANDGDAELIVFNHRRSPAKAGAHVHVLPADRVLRTDDIGGHGVGGALFANSDCPTCELWLHENTYKHAGIDATLHYHTEDEVIFVTGGEIVLGRRRFGVGTAISIAANTVYGFHTGEGGLAYVNFRASAPTFGMAGKTDTMDERQFWRPVGTPEPIFV